MNHDTGPTPPADIDVAPDYARARQAFLQAAAQRGAGVESHAHPLTGLQGEALALDLAWLGPRDARRVVVSLSGTHGVEGLYGSGCQVAALQRWPAERLPPDTALMFVHAVNPYGFSWLRRVNEDNIDVNRNFVDFDRPPANPGYAALHPLLLPATWTEESVRQLQAQIAAEMQRQGVRETTRAITGGQFSHADGVFYGGQGPCWSHRTVAALAARHLAGARALCVLDHHTGLGPTGHTELICRHPVDSTALALARQWWGADVTSPGAGESASEVLGGNIRMAFEGWCPQARPVVAIALEVGTQPSEQVMAAVMADNWLHQRGEPRSAQGDRIRQQVREAFFADTPAWRVQSTGRAMQVLDQALAGLQQVPVETGG